MVARISTSATRNFIEGWRSFNYTLSDRLSRKNGSNEVLTSLGPWADPAWANQHALEIAQAELQSLEWH